MNHTASPTIIGIIPTSIWYSDLCFFDSILLLEIMNSKDSGRDDFDFDLYLYIYVSTAIVILQNEYENFWTKLFSYKQIRQIIMILCAHPTAADWGSKNIHGENPARTSRICMDRRNIMNLDRRLNRWHTAQRSFYIIDKVASIKWSMTISMFTGKKTPNTSLFFFEKNTHFNSFFKRRNKNTDTKKEIEIKSSDSCL